MSQPIRPHRTIARRVREFRTLHGWSAQRLAERLNEVGIPWDRSIVANFENGRRQGVMVEELLALADVLHVTPVDLVVPSDVADDAVYQLAPDVAAPAGTVREWFGGQAPLREPTSLIELAEAARWVPKERGEKWARDWFTPERAQEHIRQTNWADPAFRELMAEVQRDREEYMRGREARGGDDGER